MASPAEVQQAVAADPNAIDLDDDAPAAPPQPVDPNEIQLDDIPSD